MTKQAVLVIYVSPNGRDNWKAIEPFSVPEWLKRPDIMGRLVAGEQCMDPRSPTGNDWFRADRVLTESEKRAEAKRERKQAASAGRAGEIVKEATQEARRQAKRSTAH